MFHPAKAQLTYREEEDPDEERSFCFALAALQRQ
jgi:hypothetical protein